MNVIDIIISYRWAFLYGLLVTLQLFSIIAASGIFFGSLVGVFAAYFRKTFGLFFQIISFLLSGIPVLVFLFWLHYPAQKWLDVNINPFYTAAFTFSVINIFAMGNIVREVLIDFPREYIVAARVCGIPWHQTVLRIQLPIVLRQMIPNVLSFQVIMLQSTIFASLISVDELFRASQDISSQIHRTIDIYTALALIFLIMCLPINGIALYLRYRFTRNFSEQ